MTSLQHPSNNNNNNLLQPLLPSHAAPLQPPQPPLQSSSCVRCQKTIRDPYVLTVQEQPHHPKCVQCQECCQYLEQACYSQNDAFYCKKDFYRLYGPKCQGCDYTIEMDQYSTKIGEDSFFHPECLVCSVCKLTVPSGHRVKYQDGFVYCEDHAFMCHMKTSSATATTVLPPELYERDSGIESDLSSNMGDHHMQQQQQQQHHGYSHQQQQQQRQQQQQQPLLQDLDQQKSPGDDGGCGDDKDGADSDDGKDDDDKGNKRRGPRTTIKAKQLEVLKTVFSQTPKPTRLMREQLAKETGLPMRVIQVWFQNKRSKEKRLHQMRFMARAPFLPPNARRFPGGDPRFCFPPGNGFDYGPPGGGFDPNCGPYPPPGHPGGPPPPFNPHHNPHFNPHFSPSDGSGMIYPPPPPPPHHHPQQQQMPPHPGSGGGGGGGDLLTHPPTDDGSSPPLLHSFPSPPPHQHDFSTPPPNGGGGSSSEGFGSSGSTTESAPGAEQCYPSPPLSLEYSTTPPTAGAGANPPTASLGASS